MRREVSQRELERALRKTRGYVTHIEKGSILPGDRETCEMIGDRLGVSGDEVWSALLDERLRRANPQVQAHAAAVSAGAGALTQDEVNLVRVLRTLDTRSSGGASTAAVLLRLGNLVEGSASHPESAPIRGPVAVLQSLHALNECSHRTAGEVMGILTAVVAALAAERESLGFNRQESHVAIKTKTKPRQREKPTNK